MGFTLALEESQYFLCFRLTQRYLPRHMGGSFFLVVQRSHTLFTFPEKGFSSYWIFTGIVGHNPAGGSWAHPPAPGGALLAALWHKSVNFGTFQKRAKGVDSLTGYTSGIAGGRHQEPSRGIAPPGHRGSSTDGAMEAASASLGWRRVSAGAMRSQIVWPGGVAA